jgi:hypothetical protein
MSRPVDQPFHRAAADQVLREDDLGVFQLQSCVPDIFGVNHDDGPVAALVHAAGVIDADPGVEAGLGYKVFEAGVDFDRGTIHGAGFPPGAYEDVLFKRAHEFSPVHNSRPFYQISILEALELFAVIYWTPL